MSNEARRCGGPVGRGESETVHSGRVESRGGTRVERRRTLLARVVAANGGYGGRREGIVVVSGRHVTRPVVVGNGIELFVDHGARDARQGPAQRDRGASLVEAKMQRSPGSRHDRQQMVASLEATG